MAEYGTDALRFTLAAMASPGRDIKLSHERIEGYRNFGNKLWNAARFALENIPDGFQHVDYKERELKVNVWILSRLHRCIGDVNSSLLEYRFDESANRLYQFVWHEFCDWYIEFSKPILKQKIGAEKKHPQYDETVNTIIDVLQCIVRLLHPFMPFLTEELWSKLPRKPEELEHVMVSPYPVQDENKLDEKVEGTIGAVIDVISSIRVVRSTYAISPGKVLPNVLVIPKNINAEMSLSGHETSIREMARIDSLEIGVSLKKPEGKYGNQVTALADVYIFLDGLVDFTKEQARLRRRLSQLEVDLERVENKLNNATFVANAPSEVVQKEKNKKSQLHEECNKVSLSLKQLEG